MTIHFKIDQMPWQTEPTYKASFHPLTKKINPVSKYLLAPKGMV